MALGRGLDSLLGEMDEAYDNEGTQKDSISEISLKDIRPNPFQPRKSFNEESLLELAESIKNDGLIQPITVSEDIDGYILVAGERRIRASKMAKLKTIRCIVIRTDNEKMRKYALIENIQREDLNSIDLALAYEELIKLHDITHEELSTMIHKSRTHITNTLRLLQLSPKAHKALLENKITAGHAKVLVGLDEKQQQLMINSIVGQKLSVRELEAIVKNVKNEQKVDIKKEVKKSYNFSNLKNKFNSFGLKVKTSNNKLTIEFDSDNQIEDFLNHFSK